MIQKMDDNDVPMEDRCLIILPATRNAIMGIDRYVSSDFVSGQSVNSGLIGNLYGVDIYVSSNCATIEAAADNTAGTVDTRADFSSTKTQLSWQSKWPYVHRLSTSRNTSRLCTQLTRCTVSRYTVLKLVSFSQYLLHKNDKRISNGPFFLSLRFLQ